ncbi:hypothetical protein [Methylomagnum sp.]
MIPRKAPTYDEACATAKLLRQALQAIEAAETVEDLKLSERAKLRAAKDALDEALLRIAIGLLEREMDALEQVEWRPYWRDTRVLSAD